MELVEAAHGSSFEFGGVSVGGRSDWVARWNGADV